MQISCILSSQTTLLHLPKTGFQLNSASFDCKIRKCRRKLRLKLGFSTNYIGDYTHGVCDVRRLSISLGGGWFVFGCSEIKPLLFGDHSSSSSSVGWSLEGNLGSKECVESGLEGLVGDGVDLCRDNLNNVAEEGTLGDDLDEDELLSLSDDGSSNVDETSKDGVGIVLEGTLGDDLHEGELLSSENVGSNVAEEGRVGTLKGDLHEGELSLGDGVGGGVDGKSNEGALEDDLHEGELRSSENVGRDGGELEGEETGRIDVRGLTKRLQLAKSLEDVEGVLKDEGRLPLQIFSSMIRMFGREKRLEPALAVVAWLQEKHRENEEFEGPNLFVYNSLLGAIKLSGDFSKVEVVMNDINEAGLIPNVVTYNTLMGICLDDDRAPEALKLFEDMKQKGLPLSPASYSTAMLAYRKMEDGNGALRLFLGMREKYMNGELQNCDNEDWEIEFSKLKDFTNRVCYQVMRRWLVKEENLTTNVLKLLIEMDKAGIPPSNTEYERLIWACTREEHYTVVKELYKRVRERRCDISLSVCNHVIWLMGKAKKWWAALEVYEDLLEFGPKPNNMSYELIVGHFNVLLSSARKRGIWRWGVSLLEKMEAKGLKPRSREWNAVLVACSKASETSAAVEIFKKMVERGEKPTQVSYGALLSALEKGNMYEEAIRVWEHMRKVGIEPNQYSYTIMASVYVGFGKFNLVDYIIQEMVSTGNDPTVVTFNAIISVCSRKGLGGEAYEWFERMKAMAIEPNEITYEMLIQALANDGKPRLAYDTYLRVLNEGLTLSFRAYDAVIRSSREYGATIDVIALGPRPPAPEKNGSSRIYSAEPGNVNTAPVRRKPYFKERIHAEQAIQDV